MQVHAKFLNKQMTTQKNLRSWLQPKHSIFYKNNRPTSNVSVNSNIMITQAFNFY